MLVLTIAALIYLALALGLVLVIDNMVGLLFPETRSASSRLFNLSKAFSVSQRFIRK